MIKNDRQLGKPFGLFRDTKSNVEALAGLTGGETAYATDTGEDGIYDAVAAEWVWGRSGSGAPLSDDDPEPVGETASPGVSTEASRSDHVHVGIDITGWIAVTETWTRTGNHTFTVSGNLTTKYRKGTKVRYRDGGGDEYGVVGSSSYSSPNTTVTLITNTDYAMAATTITDTYISYIENPEGYPHWFNFVPSGWIGDGGMTVTVETVDIARFSCIGNTVTVVIIATVTTGGTAGTTLRVDEPVLNNESGNIPGVAQTRDAIGGAALAAQGGLAASINKLQVFKIDFSNYGLGTGRIFRLDCRYKY